VASLDAARAFVNLQGRVLEQRLFARLFDGAPADGVVWALQAYRNPDGGFGHGLEPDKRCPASQPVDVAVALETLVRAGARDDHLVEGACAFLSSVADDHGAVPLALPSVRDFPHALEYTSAAFYVPGVWATAWAAWCLHALGAGDPWLERATQYCLRELGGKPDLDAHGIREVLRFLRHVPDPRAAPLVSRVESWLPEAAWLVRDAADDEYGVSPLELEGDLFGAEELAPHLDRLEADQQEDGGWPIRFEPPSEASHLEWRGIVSVQAVEVLRRHGRL
jgi:hypothetical protein